MDKAEWDRWNCERKERHAQQKKAEKVLKRMKLQMGARASNLVVYKCKVCKRWYHIGNDRSGSALQTDESEREMGR